MYLKKYTPATTIYIYRIVIKQQKMSDIPSKTLRQTL